MSTSFRQETTVRLGFDLDNTIIDYEALFYALAMEAGLDPGPATDRNAVRTAVRRQGTDLAWQQLQARAYGPELPRARLFPGVLETLRLFRSHEVTMWIISHKTLFSPLDTARTCSLRRAALEFLLAQGILELIPEEHVVFAADRAGKCRAIVEAGCTHFVDDLAEVFADAAFPSDVRRILFIPSWRHVCQAPPETDLLLHWEALFPLLIGKGKALNGGRNSRVFLRDHSPLPLMVEKQYHCHPADPRPRQQTEWQATQFFHARQITCVPRPLALDTLSRRSLFSYQRGQSPAPLTQHSLEVMGNFIGKLFELRGKDWLLPASEACFSLAEVEAQLADRCDALLRVVHDTPAHVDMRALLCRRILPRLEQDVGRARRAYVTMGIGIGEPLPVKCRIPSPSDFGLHNAIQGTDGRLLFVDLEYFGHDDPVKLLADVCLHPGMRLTPEQGREVVRRGLAGFSSDKDVDWALTKRFTALFPLWRIKWCCILLNEFLPGHSARRRFARHADVPSSRPNGADYTASSYDETALLDAQLFKAHQMMDTEYDPAYLLS